MTQRQNTGLPPEGKLKEAISNPDGGCKEFSGEGCSITERKKADDELRIFHCAIESSVAAVAISDMDGTVTYVNPACVLLWGYGDKSEMIGKPAFQFWASPENAKRVVAETSQGHCESGEFVAKRKDGTFFDVAISLSLVRDALGKPLGMVCSAGDITGHKRAEEVIKQEQTFSNALIDSLPNSFYVLGENGTYVRWNAYQRDEIVGQPEGSMCRIKGVDCIHPDDRALIESKVADVFSNGAEPAVEARVLVRGGPMFKWFLLTGRRLMTDGRRFLVGTGVDITERKRTEEKLRESEMSLRESQRIAGLGSYSLNISTGWWSSSDVMDEVFGIDQAYKRTVEGWKALIHPDDRAMMGEYFNAEVLGQKRPFNKEYRIVRHNDQVERWVHGTGRLDCDADGSLLRMHGTIQDITERKRAEEALRAREERHRSILQTAMDGFLIADMKGRILEVNDAYCRMSGYGEQELLGMGISDLDGVYTQDEIEARIQDVSIHGGRRFESLHRRKDGSLYDIEICNQFEPSNGGVMVTFMRDIAIRTKAADDLRRSEERLRLATSAGNMGVWDLDIVKGQRTWDSSMYVLYGISKNAFNKTDDAWFSMLHPDDRPFVEGEVQAALRGEREYAPEFRIVRPDGSIRTLKSESATVRDQNGKALRMVGTTTDITERKRAEKALMESESRFRTLIQTIPDMIWMKDMDGVYLCCNPGAERVFGTAEGEIIGKTDYDVFGREAAALFREYDRKTIESGKPCVEEEWVSIPNESARVLLETIKTPVFDVDGKCVGVLGVGRDITQRYVREHRLRQLSRATEQSPCSVVITDTEGNIEYVNPKFTEVTGYSLAEAAGKNSRVLKSGDNPPESYKELWNTIKTGGEWRGEFHNKKKNGELYWESASICPIVDPKGAITHYVAVKEDITERKKNEAALVEAKLVAEEANRLKGEFLANMSHEIRTPMNGVVGLTGLLLETPLNAEQSEYARMIRSSADGLMRVINDILDFSKIEARKLTLEIVDFDLQRVVESALEVNAERACARGIELFGFVAPTLPCQLRGDPGRLCQVLTNLLNNAVKFTARGEVVLTVSLSSETSTDALLRFEVKDSGIGMTPKVQSRLFQAFNQADGSTTRQYGGTGLGLAICKQLVTMMDGEIGVASKPESGSTFWFTIRFAKQIAVPGAAQLPMGTLAGVRVLVVHKNETGRQILHCCLSSRNMEVTSAASGREALENLEQAGTDAPFQLAIVDMEMPDMDGLTLARAIKASPRTTHPRVVALTSLGKTLSGEADRSIDACLVKPVKQSSLFDTLARVMAAHPADSVVDSEGIFPFFDSKPRRDVRILLAEDNPVNRFVALAHLKQMGYKADVVPNGEEVLRLLDQTFYDIILMDCQMPEMDGYETTRRIRAAGKNPSRPYIIALTAHATHAASERCLEAGMNDYISKPVRFAAFVAVLEKGISVSSEAGDQIG